MGYIPYTKGGITLQTFDVDFFKTTNGSCPTAEFLDSLEEKMKAKVLRTIMLLEQNGNDLREPYSKYLEDDIFELRIKQSSNISRVLYFFAVGNKIIITHGFIKKTKRTPKPELLRAKKYRTEYLCRKEQPHE